MPLPPLLLERLKRRKIIREVGEGPEAHTQPSSAQSITTPEHATSSSSLGLRYHDYQGPEPTGEVIAEDQEQEEIIAEDYSDDDQDQQETHEDCGSSKSKDAHDRRDSSHSDDSFERGESQDNGQVTGCGTESVLGCPNKYNIYHDCSQYCVDNYSQPENISPTIEQRKQLALILRTYPMPGDWTVVYDPGVRTFYFWNTITNLVSWFPPGINGFVSLPADQIRKTMKQLEQSQEI